MRYFLFLLAAAPHFLFAQPSGDLDNYVARLKQSKAAGGGETAFMSAGSDFMYGWDYYEAKNYTSAQGYFQDVLRKQPDNAFANYLVGVCLMKQNDKYKAQQAQEFLTKAFQLNTGLKERYNRDVPNAAAQPVQKNTAPGLEGYIEGLKYAKATGGEATHMNMPGNDALYGIEYYEKVEYRSAATEFALSLAKDAQNPYVNYLMAVSLAAVGETEKAKPFLQKAVAGDAFLKNRFAEDLATASAKWKKLEDSRKIKMAPSQKMKPGGALVLGNYTCNQTIYNGPNASPAFSFQYKGYFELKPDGTYRWLDNGETGRYSYDPKTGKVTWLSGYFKTAGFKGGEYQTSGSTSGQITVVYSDSYRWECGCKK